MATLNFLALHMKTFQSFIADQEVRPFQCPQHLYVGLQPLKFTIISTRFLSLGMMTKQRFYSYERILMIVNRIHERRI